MERNGNALDSLWRRVDQGTATPQDRVDAAALAGRSKDQRYVPRLLKLLQEDDAQTRHYALQSLVLDLQQTDQGMQDQRMNLLRRDPDEQVRSMAATCLGNIFVGTRQPWIFHAGRPLELLS
jgi:HEAT repeat protein